MKVLSMIPSDTPFLPPNVTDVPKEILRNYPHSKKVGNYLLGKTLGEGSFAKVKEAVHIPTGEKVAVKIIDKKKSMEDSYVRKNLRREGKILQMVRHPNIVHLLEIMETQNSYYLVTELCHGGDLMDYISQKRKLPEVEVKKYIRQIVSAVDYLHHLGILHRDLKIENLLIDEFRDIKIIDFGLSNCVKIAQTKDGPKVQEYCVTQCGSPAYAAPELLGRKKYGPQVDIWSIGVNMFAMLAGNLPFTVEPFNVKALYNKMITGQMNPLPDGLSGDCRNFIRRLLNPDPEKRISIDDILKHPWIVDVPGIPMVRAPCPNKLKTESIESSILKHMSENLGFRMGEVIRYVTGNVPSGATAMYYLIHQRLVKHHGNARATGKIAADSRIPDKNKHPLNELPTVKKETVYCNFTEQHGRSVTRPPDKHTENSIKNAAHAKTKDTNQVDKTEVKVTSNATHLVRDTKEEDERKLDIEEGSKELLQIKAANNSVSIPRLNVPIKTIHYQKVESVPSPRLPCVTNMYVFGNRNSVTKKVAANDANKKDINLITSNNIENRSVFEIKNDEAELFRPRASTFPGKCQRPSTALAKLFKSKEIKKSSSRDNNKAISSNECNSLQVLNSKKGGSDFLPSDVCHDNKILTITPRPYPNKSIIYSRPSNVQRRIANVMRCQITKTSAGSLSDDVLKMSVPKPFMSRPSHMNRLSRVSVRNNTRQEKTVVLECLTNVSYSQRPLSSRNMNDSCIRSNFRSTTPILPSLPH